MYNELDDSLFSSPGKDYKEKGIKFIENILEEEGKELSAIEEEVLKSIKEQELISKSLNINNTSDLSLGERISDKVASFGGSWMFIISFFLLLGGWIAFNSISLSEKAFDPYPFILLNLILSCIAAIQAPIIMMSQNRKEQKDRLRAEHDYKINLKAELEIRLLHEKIDYLITKQWRRLIEIQKLQMDILSDKKQE